LHIVPRIQYLGFTTRGKKGPLTTTGDLSACKSKRTLIQLLTVNTAPGHRGLRLGWAKAERQLRGAATRAPASFAGSDTRAQLFAAPGRRERGPAPDRAVVEPGRRRACLLCLAALLDAWIGEREKKRG
jgi:hypothetical protein